MISCALVCLAKDQEDCDGVIYISADKTCKIGKVLKYGDNENKNFNDNRINIWRKTGKKYNTNIFIMNFTALIVVHI